MIEKTIQQDLEKETGLALTDNFRQELSAYINQLINNDFEKLVFLLYRIDVKESTIKQLLALPSSQNAGEIIADAIIKRQLEKVISRQQYKQPTENIADDDKW